MNTCLLCAVDGLTLLLGGAGETKSGSRGSKSVRRGEEKDAYICLSKAGASLAMEIHSGISPIYI